MLCIDCNTNESNPDKRYGGRCSSCRHLKYGTKSCPQCGKRCDKKASMCHACFAEHERRFQVKRTCKECKKIYTTKVSDKKVFCSSVCRIESHSREMRLGGEHSLRWNNNAITIESGYHISYDHTRKDRNRISVQIAEKTLGRRIKKGEVVHHINMNKLDDSRSNLLICSNSYHLWLHHQMQLQWVKKILLKEER